jgi:hypothetical protein
MSFMNMAGFPATGAKGIDYYDASTGLTYYWSATKYVLKQVNPTAPYPAVFQGSKPTPPSP